MPATMDPPVNQPKPKRVPFFTKDNAKHFSELAQKAIQDRIERARLTKERERLKLDYREIRLLRVRKQLDKLDKEIERAVHDDPKKLRDLVQAQNQLSQQEQMLSMRPGPGTIKPLPERRASGRPTIEMEE